MKINFRAARFLEFAKHGREKLEDNGYTNVCAVKNDSDGSIAYIAEGEKTLYLTFDVPFNPYLLSSKRFSSYGLHRGAWEVWRDLSDQVAAEILQRRAYMANGHSPEKEVVYCGHGHNGALAVIAAATHSPDFCITFGTPPVGGSYFREVCEESYTVFNRFVMDTDPEPRRLRFNPFYRHAGNLFFVNERMELERTRGWFARFTQWFRAASPDDHEMHWYRSAVWINGV